VTNHAMAKVRRFFLRCNSLLVQVVCPMKIQ